jgi:hypothetical protein
MSGRTDERRPEPPRQRLWPSAVPDVAAEPDAAPPGSPPGPADDVAHRQFEAALIGGNPREVRRAAAALSAVSLADAAGILLVIERTEPENYERTALQWLARLAGETPRSDLRAMARAADALAALPSRTAARAELACICHDLSLPDAAGVFARDHERFAQERERLEHDAPPPRAPEPEASAGSATSGPDQPRELVEAR